MSRVAGAGVTVERASEPAAPGTSTPRVAVIGCGAIARSMHLPALARHEAVLRQAVLVDRDRGRAAALADKFGVGDVATDYREVADGVDAALVTVPHHLHYRIARDLVERGVSVLCEKPLTETEDEARRLLAAAEAGGAVVAANYTKRLYPSYRKVRDLIRRGAIGEVREVACLWGEVFDWPAASGFYFGRLGSGKGVLLDRGAHVIDLICWWLGGTPELVGCRDDSLGGSEAVSEVRLRVGSATATVRLSWLSRYESGFTIRGSAGTIRVGVYDWNTVRLEPTQGGGRTIHCDASAHSPAEFGAALIDDFLAVARRGGGEPLIPGADVVESIRLIEACYARRERFDMPWHEPVEATHA